MAVNGSQKLVRLPFMDDPESMAEMLHARYETLAPFFSYETPNQDESEDSEYSEYSEYSAPAITPWCLVADRDRNLMIEVCKPFAYELKKLREHSAALEREIIRQANLAKTQFRSL